MPFTVRQPPGVPDSRTISAVDYCLTVKHPKQSTNRLLQIPYIVGTTGKSGNSCAGQFQDLIILQQFHKA